MSSSNSRNLIITSIESLTGSQIAKTILGSRSFSKNINQITGLTLQPDAETVNELVDEHGVNIIEHKPGDLETMVNTLTETGADTICLLPPGHKDAYDITVELIEATKKANIPNVCFISSAGCDLAERDAQPLLRSVIDLETKVMQTKGDASTETGHSPVIVRRGFYAEHLLSYSKQAQEQGKLPLPIGKNHKFAPMALSDAVEVIAHVLSGTGKHGFSDKHRGQLMVLTGPQLTAGEELATAASQALGEELKFEDISPEEAKSVLKDDAGSSEGEIAYLLEYFSLVREGKTNYISTTAFHDVTGKHPVEPTGFFKNYAEEMRPEKANKKRKTQ
ncbi:hypothetical protein BDW74DRAFT_155226 [Aspergillus multicolor]|uniref:uncharacterized protein n=1 Tax=Aspergillus multicolor TaxID=41759 RepID=UPI003CCDB5E0